MDENWFWSTVPMFITKSGETEHKIRPRNAAEEFWVSVKTGAQPHCTEGREANLALFSALCSGFARNSVRKMTTELYWVITVSVVQTDAVTTVLILRRTMFCKQWLSGVAQNLQVRVTPFSTVGTMYLESCLLRGGAHKSSARPGRKKPPLPNSGFIHHTPYEAQYTS